MTIRCMPQCSWSQSHGKGRGHCHEMFLEQNEKELSTNRFNDSQCRQLLARFSGYSVPGFSNTCWFCKRCSCVHENMKMYISTSQYQIGPYNHFVSRPANRLRKMNPPRIERIERIEMARLVAYENCLNIRIASKMCRSMVFLA
jgi:hypothetical protein